jgi:hypothetical protein
MSYLMEAVTPSRLLMLMGTMGLQELLKKQAVLQFLSQFEY